MTAAIIVAAGRGTRMGTDIDKIFLEVTGKPIVVHTWERFASHPMIDQIVLVVRHGLENTFHDLAAKYSSVLNQKPFALVAGGNERQDSVWNGLQSLSPEVSLVAIQDAARPCTRAEVISQILLTAEQTGAAVAAQRATDTIKQSGDGKRITSHLDRSQLWTVQTPQAFRREVIHKALKTAMDQGVIISDDTAACELIQQSVTLVECPWPNPKATSPSDLAYIELILNQT